VIVNERSYKVLLAPHVSEKASIVGDRHRQYVFKVIKDADKHEIKKAVEHLFKVSVEKVRIVNKKPTTVRTKNGMGRRSGWKKAYVKVAEGHAIDFSGLV
jgi:large subunit ribosomal protein L23